MAKQKSKKARNVTVKVREKQPIGLENSEKLRERLGIFNKVFGVDSSKRNEPWDRELTKEELFRTAPLLKGKRTLVSFVRKVTLLVDMMDDQDLRDTISVNEYKTPTALRRWSDPDRGLWPWSVPEIDSPDGTYGDLFLIYESAEAGLDIIRKGKKYSLQKQIDDQKRVIENLEAQILDLMDQLYRATSNAGKSIRAS
ncbi:hypothetical protein J2Z19_003742 [Ensifer adhaerens]|uniref:Uncharacterized protein n=1 Tax=Ensifer adhaerens TaxID=106592 RepID=A0ACC5SYP9_ENSAD|nr:hypothetical protein [Ensifer adhaerens]MBP1874018.1 hypothetical protein [Ensifer adhaerens]